MSRFLPIKIVVSTWFVALYMLTTPAFSKPPSIESFSPPAGQLGTEFELRIVGAELLSATELKFYSSELTCKKFEPSSDYEAVATVSMSKECKLGYEPFRILGRDGFSELATLRITPLPIVLEDSLDESGDLTAAEYYKLRNLNASICGVLDEGDIDRYAVDLLKSQTLSVEVDAVRLGDRLLDTVLSIKNPAGEVIVSVDDGSLFQQDPTTAIIAPETGQYMIEIHETNYSGSDDNYYILHIGDFAPPSISFPAGGKRGTSQKVRFIEDSRTWDETIEIPPGPEPFALFSQVAISPSPSSTPFRVVDFGNVFENEISDSFVATAPIALNGILEQPGDSDRFPFAAEVGEGLRIDAFADRIGSPVDTVIRVVDKLGNVIQSNDDWGSHDSRIDFFPPASDDYWLEVSDKLAAGCANGVYRIELTRIEPKLTAFIPRPENTSQRGQTINVPRGNRSLIRMAVRRDRIDGEVRVQFVDLPAGVGCQPQAIPPDQFWVPMVVEANANAPQSGTYADVEVTCVGNGLTNGTEDNDASIIRGSFEQIVDLVTASADRLFQSAIVDRFPIAVTPPIPFHINLHPLATELPVGGTLTIRIQIERETGFNQPVRVEFPFLPPEVVGEPFLVIPGGDSEGEYTFHARPYAVPRAWPVVAIAKVDTLSAEGDTDAFDGREVASHLIELTIGPSPIKGRFEVIATEQGTKFSAGCQISVSGQLPSDLLAEVEGLPNRVTADPVAVSEIGQTINFNVQAADDAPLGAFENLQVRLTGSIEGQRISYVIAANSLLKITEPGKLYRDSAGQLLSPLEALRQRTKD